MTLKSFARLALALGSLSVCPLACSSSDSEPGATAMCNADPWSCPAGQTCWSSDTLSSSFQCYNSGTGAVGDSCEGVVGVPDCKDGLTCCLLQGYPKQCTPFCDPTSTAHSCPTGYTCITGTTQGGQKLSFCRPPVATDSGVEAGNPETGAPEAGEASADSTPTEVGVSDSAPEDSASETD